jgi:hypothetical protein
VKKNKKQAVLGLEGHFWGPNGLISELQTEQKGQSKIK